MRSVVDFSQLVDVEAFHNFVHFGSYRCLWIVGFHFNRLGNHIVKLLQNFNDCLESKNWDNISLNWKNFNLAVFVRKSVVESLVLNQVLDTIAEFLVDGELMTDLIIGVVNEFEDDRWFICCFLHFTFEWFW